MNKIEKIDLPYFIDDRGVFRKFFNGEHPALKDFHIKQINQVNTIEKGVLRGLHYQTGEFAESKLFKVIKGRIQLATFCIDKDLKTFLESSSFELSETDSSILIPRGYATGYLVLEKNTEVLYCSDNIYEPTAEKGILWDDHNLKIKWLINNPILSEKDKSWEKFYVN
ncbi:dTDP-4-dehydrorhamnose 3,5-epimerase family protein [Marivirga arenosa]|uniref:dTDP-4-dehydrorhamnose 3,5-epimerase n=1 Tax=Marivirga arenosa TaxID=3059076 RepID=A0AA51RDS5_9BACT|nr:dTDP-4-dehydrorhamnose 3,5-epimerase family protein [Marivirga sp. ABR2-2]WMN07700.1 dTDP-4-dehydrorhamnose 3,5-epimerase family protein [Marivirga sp. ABR2-2]